MQRKGRHRPTIEEAVEISGIETLHPGGFALTRRTAQLAGLRPGLKVLDVSSGRGTQACYYAQEFGVQVSGVDLSPSMVAAAATAAGKAGLSDRVRFRIGDSQDLPFPSDGFDVAINECAVGIPDDPQLVLNEMVRVVRPGGVVAIHESTWRQTLEAAEKDDLTERYGTTPQTREEWHAMLVQAGVAEIIVECDPWSRPEMFWKIRQDRDVAKPSQVLHPYERLRAAVRIHRRYGLRGVWKVFENERVFFRAVQAGKLGYCLFKGVKA
jgi:ubiquinone/menaquinone biosynthesis C-methylase UbiE